MHTHAQRETTHIVRILFSGWLASDDDELGYLAKIDQRIEDITGLSMETAEQLQVSYRFIKDVTVVFADKML